MGIVDDIKKDADKTFTKIQSTQEKEIEQMSQCAKGCDIIEPEEQRTRRTYKKRTRADTGRMKGAWLWRR